MVLSPTYIIHSFYITCVLITNHDYSSKIIIYLNMELQVL